MYKVQNIYKSKYCRNEGKTENDATPDGARRRAFENNVTTAIARTTPPTTTDKQYSTRLPTRSRWTPEVPTIGKFT